MSSLDRDEEEFWAPTMTLRLVDADNPFAKVEFDRIRIQQMWVSVKGGHQWIDIPHVDASEADK